MILEGEIARAGASAWGWLETEDGEIVDTGEGRSRRPAHVRTDMLIAPGYVDLQVNGALGLQITDGLKALEEIDNFQLSHGVTSYLPTVITTDPKTAHRAVLDIATRAAEPDSPVAGAHLEGPFLSPDWCGVHRRELLQTPIEGVPSYYAHRAVKLVTLAPELAGAIGLTERLSRNGCKVAIGHSGAEHDAITRAVRAGARLVTHLFNAMPPFHQRRPGLAGWALTHDDLMVDVIADGRHVAPDALALVRRAAADRVILVTDMSAAAGTSPGSEYQQSGVLVHINGEGAAVTSENALAGGAVGLDECVRQWMVFTGARLLEAVEAASVRPARLIGKKHDLEPGSDADLILLKSDGTVERTMLRGDWVS